jgi:hypothetical protein
MYDDEVVVVHHDDQEDWQQRKKPFSNKLQMLFGRDALGVTHTTPRWLEEGLH